MLRGFRKPYKKLFDGEVFTTVRVRGSSDSYYAIGRSDVIALYPRSKRYLRLGRAEIIATVSYSSIDDFAAFCTEDFARYDAGLSHQDFIISLKRQAKRRKIKNPWILVYTYLWIEKEDGWSQECARQLINNHEESGGIE